MQPDEQEGARVPLGRKPLNPEAEEFRVSQDPAYIHKPAPFVIEGKGPPPPFQNVTNETEKADNAHAQTERAQTEYARNRPKRQTRAPIRYQA